LGAKFYHNYNLLTSKRSEKELQQLALAAYNSYMVY